MFMELVSSLKRLLLVKVKTFDPSLYCLLKDFNIMRGGLSYTSRNVENEVRNNILVLDMYLTIIPGARVGYEMIDSQRDT